MFCLAKPDQIDAAKDLIKKLTFPFDSESFENPGMLIEWYSLELCELPSYLLCSDTETF